MFHRLIIQMREKIRRLNYIVTLHAEEEMTEDGFGVLDLERGILSGRIIERQKDNVTAEWKYRILGKAVNGKRIEVVVKLSITGKLVIITVYPC
jgi:hypothetical protein